MKERFAILMIVALAVGVSVPTAHADFKLFLEAGGVQTTITDDLAGDLLPLDPGIMVFAGSVDGWTINVTTGLSKPAIGGQGVPKLELTSVDVSVAGADPLTIKLTDTDFLLPPAVGAQAVLVSAIGGLTVGDVTFTQILDRENLEFAEGSLDSVPLTIPLVAGPGGVFGGTASIAAPVLDYFSLTEVVTIAAGTTSFDASSAVVPVPAAFLLGMLGLGVAGLKLRRSV